MSHIAYVGNQESLMSASAGVQYVGW